MNMKLVLASTGAVIALALAAPASASVTFYGNQAAFQAAAPGLPTETFAGLAADLGLGPSGAMGINNPVNSTLYAGMVPGATYSANTSNGGDVAVVGPNYVGSTLDGYGLFSNYFGGMVIDFAPGVGALSLDTYSLFGASNATINVFDAGGLIGSLSFAVPNNGPGAFFGVTSTTGITEITMSADGGQSPGFTNVSFGNAVPEPAAWALMIGGFGMAGASLRRRKSLAA
jgi:hypothetical protein